MSVPYSQFADMHDQLFDQFSEPATAQRGVGAAVPVRVIVGDGVAQQGMHGKVISRLTKLSFIRAEYQPERGDVITLNGVARKVEAIDTDDGMLVEAVVHG